MNYNKQQHPRHIAVKGECWSCWKRMFLNAIKHPDQNQTTSMAVNEGLEQKII